MERARQKVAGFVNAPSTNEIVFTKNVTEAINLVAQSFGRGLLREGDEVLVSELEHHSNIVPWQLICEERGAKLRVARLDDDGDVDMEEFERLLSERKNSEERLRLPKFSIERAAIAAFWAQVDNPVRGFNHVQIMLDNDHGIAGIHQTL